MNLIEKLNDLCTEYEGGALALSVVTDLRAIIEQAKREAVDPVAWLCVWKPTGASFPTKLKADMEHFKAHGYEIIPLIARHSPDIVAELVKALEDDAYAATFQSMAGYRTALIAKVNGVVG